MALFVVPGKAFPDPLSVGTVIHEQVGIGNCAEGNVPVVRSDADTVTFDVSA